MGAEPIAANFEPSTPLDEQAIATEKLRRKRRNKCAEIQRATSDLADEFDWVDEMIHHANIPAEHRTLLQTIQDARKHTGRRTITIDKQNDLCAPSGLGEANVSRCIKDCRNWKILRWVRNSKNIDVGIFPPVAGFWVHDDGSPIGSRTDGKQWVEFINNIEGSAANQYPELFVAAYSLPPATCLGSKSATASAGKVTCSASNLVLPFGGDSSVAPQSTLPDKQVPLRSEIEVLPEIKNSDLLSSGKALKGTQLNGQGKALDEQAHTERARAVTATYRNDGYMMEKLARRPSLLNELMNGTTPTARKFALLYQRDRQKAYEMLGAAMQFQGGEARYLNVRLKNAGIAY